MLEQFRSMHKLDIDYKGWRCKYKFPSEFNEMTSEQLEYVVPKLPLLRKLYAEFCNAQIIGSHTKKLKTDIALQGKRLKVLMHLLGIHKMPTWGLRVRLFYHLNEEEIHELMKLMNFIFENPIRNKPVFKRLWLGVKPFYSPGENMTALTAEEFHFASRFYNEYTQGKTESLNLLLATIYRPKGTGSKHNPLSNQYCGDKREPFNRHTLERRAAQFSKLKHDKKRVIVFWWESFYVQLVKGNPTVFKPSSESKPNPEGWLPIFRALAKSPLHTEEIGKQRLSLLLYELHKLDQEAIEFKRQVALNKTKR